MANISKTNSLSAQYKTGGKLMMLLLILFAICTFSQRLQADTSIYVFGPDQSMVIKTGGFAGVNITYAVTGQFRLTVDSDSGVASFEVVDANLADETGSEYGRSLDEIFNMTGLLGTVVDDMTIEFEGKTADGTESDVSLKLTIREDSAHLTGKTTPPPNSADMFFYDIDAVATKKYAGGTGESNEPYLIYTAEHLNAIGTEPNDWDKHFKLMVDLDLSGVSLNNRIGIWSSIDENNKPFSGVFDGNGKTIANFTSVYRSWAGLFSYVSGINAEIRNLTLIDPNISGLGYTGSLVGQLDEGTIRNCDVIGGSVNGLRGAGGLIGHARYGVIERCISSANVTGTYYVGGLVGGCYYETLITNCGATGSVYGDFRVGGLVGDCGSVAPPCVIAGSFASGDISSSGSCGGLVGSLEYSQIICCYANGSVSGSAGLVGHVSNAYIVNSYSSGQVTGANASGFSYNDGATAYDCFWDTDTSGVTTSGLGTGLSTKEMQDPNTFLNAGWDFFGELDNGPSDIWIMPVDGGYPVLTWQVSPLPPLLSFSGGTGEPNDPFIISTPQEFNSIGHNPRLMSANFRLANDIDLVGIHAFPIGDVSFPFMGIFNGNGYIVSNFSYEATPKNKKHNGLFRYVRGMKAEIRDLTLSSSSVSGASTAGTLIGLLYGGTVINCHVEESEVSASANSEGGVGGLIGLNKYGIVESCTSSAIVRGEGYMGGLLGANHEGIIFDCHSSGDVFGGHYGPYVGGLTGTNYNGYIEFCTVSGNVSSTNRQVGGLAGDNWGLISNCVSSGNVSGDWRVGGVAGHNVGLIVASCSYSDIIGQEFVGGLVGVNIGDISNCYARGNVTGNENVGGLVGNNTYHPNVAGEIETSYSTGFVSGNKNVGGLVYTGSHSAITSDDCFWDIDTSGQTIGDSGTGKTTAEMQMASTFLEADWDFMDETANGTEDIWWILEGQDYPRLSWEAHD